MTDRKDNAHEIRMREELKALAEKLEKLNVFIGTEKYAGLDYHSRQLMQRQRDAMQVYHDILQDRVDLLK